jgi:hypothetical protein
MALSIAVVMSAMVSGGKDACGKSFMRRDPLNFAGFVAQLLNESKQPRRQADGQIQAGPKPLTDFLADCRLVDAGDLNAAFLRGMSHEISNSRQSGTEVRNSAAGGHEPSFRNFRAPGGRPQTGRRDVRPDLRRAIQQGRPHLEAVSLGERRRLTGFDLGGQSR